MDYATNTPSICVVHCGDGFIFVNEVCDPEHPDVIQAGKNSMICNNECALIKPGYICPKQLQQVTVDGVNYDVNVSLCGDD